MHTSANRLSFLENQFSKVYRQVQASSSQLCNKGCGLLTNNMTRKTHLKVGVVPEHFSLPWHRAKATGIFSSHDLEIELIPQPRGTGAMCRGLRNRELDVAVALTEGVIADIATNGGDIRMIGTYVQSPLHWGVAASSASYQTISDLEGKVFGISRFGSGSHLMTYLMADQQRWNANDLKFQAKGGIEDLLGGLQDRTTDAFLWETFTLKPFVDNHQIRNIGEVVTPWPCFVIATNQHVLDAHRGQLRNLLTCVQEATKNFKEQEAESLDYISKECHLNHADSKKWFDQVEFSKDSSISKRTLEEALEILTKTRVLNNSRVDLDSLYDAALTTITN